MSSSRLILPCLGPLIVGTMAAQTTADLVVVEARVGQNILGSVPSAATVASSRTSLQANGSWPDINYASTSQTNWAPQGHLDRLRVMCRAYAHPNDSLYQDASLLADILKAYDWWIADDPQSTNWWYNQISVPQALGECMVLIKEQLSASRKSSGQAVIQRAYIARTTNYGTNTGQNRVDRAIAGIYRGVVSGSTSITADAFLAISDTILVTTSEGIQRDGSFFQHGAQLYNQGYGSLFISNTLKWAAVGAGTGFAFSENQRRILADYLLDGTRWMNRGQVIDYTASGRGISRKYQSTNAAGLAGLATTTAAVFPGYRSAELDALRASINAANATGSADTVLSHTGAKHFWRGDFTAWHRPAGYASVKISSTRTLQPESGNGEGLKNYHLGDGVNLILRTGNEYDDIMPVWNWRKLPGTTVEQGTYSLEPSSDWGVAGTSTYAGGISDGTHAATAFRYSRRNVAAKKAWFFFDSGFVALGADIDAPSSTAEVETTLNQSLLNGAVTYSTGGAPQTLATGTSTLAGLRWVHHDGIGYFFNEAPASASLQATSQSGNWQSINDGYDTTSVSKNVFALSVRHGTAFSNKSYAYTVVPGLAAAEMADYESSLAIVRNDATAQAVDHAAVGLTQAAFYAAGSITWDGRSLAANTPGMAQWERSANAIRFAASTPEAKATTIQLTATAPPGGSWFDAFGTQTVTSIGLPGGDLAGSTAGVQITNDGGADPRIRFEGSGGLTSLACAFQAPITFPGNTELSSDAASLSFTGALAGSASLLKTGGASLQLSGTNSYTGATIIRGGDVTLANDSSAATGGWDIGPDAAAPATVDFLAGSKVSVAGGKRIRIGNDISTGTAAQLLNVAGEVVNHGSLHVGRPGTLNLKSGGNWSQLGAAKVAARGGYTSSFTVESGGLLTYDGPSSFDLEPGSAGGNANVTVAGGTLTTSRAFSNPVSGGTASAVISLHSGGTLKLASDLTDLATGFPILFRLGTGGGKVNTDGHDAAIHDVISDIAGQSGDLTKTGSGQLTLTESNTYSGGTTVSSGGGTLIATRPEALGSGPLSVPKSGTASGTLALAFDGTGTVTNPFTGFNSTTFAGDATVPTIHHLSGDAAITSDLTISGMGGNGLYVRSDGQRLKLAGTIRHTVGTIRQLGLGGSGEGIVSGAILSGTGGMGLVKDGSGIWTLSSANTYNSRTTINAGILRLDGAGTPGSAEILINPEGILDFHQSGVLTLPNDLAGAGTLIQSGSGRTVLSGVSTRTGVTHILAGTLALTAASLPDAAGVKIAATGTLELAHSATDTIATLEIGGIPQPAGLWGAPGSGATYESPCITGNGRLLVQSDPFTLWLDAHPSLTERSEDGDDDGDGWPNLLEHALGLDPLVADPRPLTRFENGMLSMQFLRPAIPSGVTVIPEWSEDLEAWHTGGVESDVSTAPVIQVRVPSGTFQRFLRLRATRP
jgi:autotransporter-associated beta strand protein